jgi:hypothetical protein
MPADLLTDLRALLARVPEGYTEGPYHAWLNSVWLVSGAGVDCPVADCDPLHSPANAHLFALAPDLAAALARAVEALEGFEERAEKAEATEKIAQASLGWWQRSVTTEREEHKQAMKVANKARDEARRALAESRGEVERLTARLAIMEAERDGWVDGEELEAALSLGSGQDGGA